jgi:rod shape-determining protein MreC
MSVVGHQPPPFFRRGPAPVVRLGFFVVLSLVLFGIDLRFKYLDDVREIVTVITYPLQLMGLAPVLALRGAGERLATLSSLRADNETLRRRQVEAAAAALRNEQLERENQRLRHLLELRDQDDSGGTLAEILYAGRDPFRRKVIIDKGQRDDVQAGQAVVDDLGVVGQVTRAYPATSEVTLITDEDQATPVQVSSTGLRAVLFGAGGGLLELRFLSASAEVREGDVVTTSGLDGVYAAGLPVARIVRVEREGSGSFARILCVPVAGVERPGAVMVLAKRRLPPPPESDAPIGRPTGPNQTR